LKKLKVILLESPLELAPPSWPYGPLIDKRYHYHKLSAFTRKWKRGRPDIVHTTLLVLLDSLLNANGSLEVYVHTLDGKVYYVSPEERLPKHYDAFKQIMAQLLQRGKVPPEGEPLMWLAYESLSDFVKEHGKIILLWEKGEPRRFKEIASEALETGAPVGIGAFPRGDFEKSTLRKSAKRYSVFGGRPLKAWTVAYKLVCAAEELLGLE